MTTEDVDSQLVELSRSIDDFVDLAMKDNSEYSIFCIGAKMNENASESIDRLQTCLAAGGRLSVIEESLYAEIANQILSGDARLYFMLSNVVESLDEQLGEQISDLEDSDEDDSEDDEIVEVTEHSDGESFNEEFQVGTTFIFPPGSTRKH